MTTRPDLDQGVRAACGAGDFSLAANLILTELGADLVRFIHARFRSDQHTADVFSMFAEDLWLGLPGFAFRGSVKAWVYTLARNAGSRFLQREVRPQRSRVPLSAVPEAVEQAAAMVRTATMARAATQREQRLAELRKELSEEDYLILMLRVERGLDFLEIGQVTLGQVDPDPATLAREAARLRKRVQLLKQKLKKRWQEQDKA